MRRTQIISMSRFSMTLNVLRATLIYMVKEDPDYGARYLRTCYIHKTLQNKHASKALK